MNSIMGLEIRFKSSQRENIKGCSIENKTFYGFYFFPGSILKNGLSKYIKKENLIWYGLVSYPFITLVFKTPKKLIKLAYWL